MSSGATAGTSGPVEIPGEVNAQPAVLTFLIADIRGYTAFTVERGDEEAARLTVTFAAIAGEVVGSHGGDVVELRGDEVLAVFRSARQAVRAAVEMQGRFRQAYDADPGLPLHVGIGLDAGEAVPVSGGFRGRALNLAARLCSLASSGEVFVSEELAHLAGDTAGIVYLDRGQVALKGLPHPAHVYQAVLEGAASAHVARFTARPGPSTNLPAQATSFIGRERELEAITGTLRREDVRLLTLTGPPGTGKTRLALEAAAALLPDFPDGVFLVSLAPLVEPEMIAPLVATTLGVRGTETRPIIETLVEYLDEKQLLLVLDNFEHLLPAAPGIAGLLATCPRLKILVTSRSALDLSAEHQYLVPSLSTPDLEHLPAPERLSAYDAVALFTQRAQAANAGFVLTEESAPAVAEICHRLDGLPLALELAAARMKLFPPGALLKRLSNRMEVLTGGAQDLPPRQRTLRSTIEWSYDLLERDEQRLFARMSVFSGRCSLEAIEAICGDDLELDILDAVASLVRQSLLRPAGEADGEPLFLMLETLKEYASLQLRMRGEEETLRRRHAAYFVELAERAEPEVWGPSQALWLSRLETEIDNLRAVLPWALECGEIEIGLRLTGALWRFWQVHGFLGEGYQWIQAFLEAQRPEGIDGPEREPSAARAKALMLASAFATNQGNYAQAQPLAEASRALYAQLQDDAGVAAAVNVLGNIAYFQGRYDEARTHFEDSLALRRRLGNQRDLAMSLNNLGSALFEQGDAERAMPLFHESLAIERSLQDRLGIAFSLSNLGEIACRQGNLEQAAAFLQESLALQRELGDNVGMADSLRILGDVAGKQGDPLRAAALLRDALALYRQVGDQWGCAACLEGIAAAAGAQGLVDRAARLFGAASALRDAIGAPVSMSMRRVYDAGVTAARASLGEERFARLWGEGRTMSAEQVEDETSLL